MSESVSHGSVLDQVAFNLAINPYMNLELLSPNTIYCNSRRGGKLE